MKSQRQIPQSLGKGAASSEPQRRTELNSGGGGGGGGGGPDRTERPSLTSSNDPVRVPDEPWLEKNWEINPSAHEGLRELYGDYFQRIHGVEGDRVLIDLALCQLNCFVAIDALLNRKLLLILVNSRAKGGDRYITRQEFVALMFFLSFASKEQLEEAVFDIVSDGRDRVTMGQLVQMHSHMMHRPLSCQVINLISECDRSGCGQLDVYDFRLLITKLQQMEQLEGTQAQPPVEREREKMDEALLEAHDLQSWSWDIAVPHLRMSSQLRSLSNCRALLEQHPSLGEAMSRLAWDYPEMMSAAFAKSAINHCFEAATSAASSPFSSSGDEDAQDAGDNISDAENGPRISESEYAYS